MYSSILLISLCFFSVNSFCQGFMGNIQFDGQNVNDNDVVSISNNNYSRLGAYTFSNDQFEIPCFVGFRARGTDIVPENVQSQDRISGFYGGALLNGTYRITSAIEIYAAPNFNSNFSPSYMVFGTTPNGSVSRQERMRLTEDGYLGIGTHNPKTKLEVQNGDIYISDITKGVIMKSPNGQCWRMTINNSGNTNIQAISCP